MKSIQLSKLILIFFLIPLLGACQSLKFITELDNKIDESSGLIHLQNKLITHNDSGGKAALYEIDSLTGQITRKVKISNAENVDWEDICHDNEFIYIADIGNNKGNRTDLKIYKIAILEYFNSTNNSVHAEIINISYKDQKDFSKRNRAHNFDAETLISYKDSLYIFTKNWRNFKTRIYPVCKTPGDYKLTSSGTINIRGLVTGGTYNSSANAIYLSGYFMFVPFAAQISHFDNSDFSNGRIKKIELNASHSHQIESIVHQNNNNYLLTAEEDGSGPPSLYKLNSNIFVKTSFINDEIKYIYPNPTTGILNIKKTLKDHVEIFSLRGKLKITTQSSKIDVTGLKKGVYYIKVMKPGSNKFKTYSFIKK